MNLDDQPEWVHARQAERRAAFERKQDEERRAFVAEARQPKSSILKPLPSVQEDEARIEELSQARLARGEPNVVSSTADFIFNMIWGESLVPTESLSETYAMYLTAQKLGNRAMYNNLRTRLAPWVTAKVTLLTSHVDISRFLAPVDYGKLEAGSKITTRTFDLPLAVAKNIEWYLITRYAYDPVDYAPLAIDPDLYSQIFFLPSNLFRPLTHYAVIFHYKGEDGTNIGAPYAKSSNNPLAYLRKKLNVQFVSE